MSHREDPTHFFDRLDVTVGVDLRSSWVEPRDKFPLLDWEQVFLSFDDDDLVLPDGVL